MPVLVERTTASRTLYEGRVVRLELLEIATDDGRTAKREIIRHAGATVVLARLPNGRFVFVRQYRKAVETALVEAIAGGIEPGETPEECARREVAEESGYGVARIRALGPIVCCPGYSTEILHGFVADLEAQAGSQSPDEDENVEVLTLTADETEAWIADGRIWDGKTLALWTLLKLKPDARG